MGNRVGRLCNPCGANIGQSPPQSPRGTPTNDSASQFDEIRGSGRQSQNGESNRRVRSASVHSHVSDADSRQPQPAVRIEEQPLGDGQPESSTAGVTARPDLSPEELRQLRAALRYQNAHTDAPVLQRGALDDENLRDFAKDVYRRNRYFHGTSEDAKESIGENGFAFNLKTPGATAKVGVGPGPIRDSAEKHHHVTERDTVAENYALMHSNPAMVRVICRPQDLGLVRDPGSERSQDAWATTKDIPPKYVVGSKRQPPGADAEVFQNLLSRVGVDNVTRKQAGKLLREVQSDSEGEEQYFGAYGGGDQMPF